jgi:hypothetical protein
VQDDMHASLVHAEAGYTPSDDSLRAAIRRAHALHLRVTLFPLLRLLRRTPAEWRGIIRPDDEARWFQSYGALVERLAALARDESVERLSIGSELGSMEHSTDEWRRMIARVRELFPGQLLYSANWDRYERVPFWSQLDLIGISAYWEVILSSHRATIDEALAAWQPIRARLKEFGHRVGRPLVLTEIGYPSVAGAGSWPWNDFLDGEAGREDQETQRRLYEAFCIAFARASELGGVYFWFWISPGGSGDRSYSPRRKAAEWVIREWYRRRPPLP